LQTIPSIAGLGNWFAKGRDREPGILQGSRVGFQWPRPSGLRADDGIEKHRGSTRSHDDMLVRGHASTCARAEPVSVDDLARLRVLEACLEALTAENEISPET